MSRAEIIEKTVNALNKLPEIQGEEAADFADFMVKKNRLSIKMCKFYFSEKCTISSYRKKIGTGIRTRMKFNIKKSCA